MSQRSMIVLDNSSEDVVRNGLGLPTIDIYDSSILNGTSWGVTSVSSMTAMTIYSEIVTPNTATLNNTFLDISTEHPTTGGIVASFYKNAPTITTTGTGVVPLNQNLGDTTHTTTTKFHVGMVYDSSLTAANLLQSVALSSNYPDATIGKYLLAKNSRYTLKLVSASSNTTAHINVKWNEA